MIARAAKVLVFFYALMLCVVGIAGILSARWELAQIFKLDFASLDVHTQATFLNQYRFLKGLELGGGIFCLSFIPQILAGGKIAKVFLALVAAGVVARSVAWLADGRPSWPFVTFLALEALVSVVTVLHLRHQNRTPTYL